MNKNYKWLVLALLGCAYFFHQADRAIFGALLPYIQSDLGLSDLELGHVTTFMFATIAVVTFFAGFLGDRFNRARIITFSLMFWSLATMMMGFAGKWQIFGFAISAYAVVVLLRALATGGGESFYGPSSMSLLASYHTKTRSFAFSIHQAALYLGLMFSGILAAGLLGIVHSWRGVFMIFGGAGLLLGILFIFVLKENPDDSTRSCSPSAQPRTSMLASFKAFFTTPSALLLTCGFVAICCVNNTYITWAPKMIHERFGIDGATAGAHAMFYHHLVAFGAILAGGWLTDRLVSRWPRFRLVLQFSALALGAPALYLVGTSGSYAFAIGMTAIYGLFRGLFEVNTHASVFEVIPAEHRASVVGFMLLLAMGLGAVFSGELMGWISDAFPGRAPTIAFAIMGATYLLGAIAILIAFLFTFNRDRAKAIK